MPSTDELRAALAVAELEEQLADAKATPEGPTAELKLELREARRTHREMTGGGTANPAVIETAAAVEGVN